MRPGATDHEWQPPLALITPLAASGSAPGCFGDRTPPPSPFLFSHLALLATPAPAARTPPADNSVVSPPRGLPRTRASAQRASSEHSCDCAQLVDLPHSTAFYSSWEPRCRLEDFDDQGISISQRNPADIDNINIRTNHLEILQTTPTFTARGRNLTPEPQRNATAHDVRSAMSLEERLSSPHSFSGYKPPSPTPPSPPLPIGNSLVASMSASLLPSNTLPSLQPSDAASRFASSSVAAPIIHFDPNSNQSDDDDDDEEASGRPKKKLRKTVAAGLVGPGAADSGLDGGAGAGVEDDKDKGRRKIEIEYINKKEKRHITFSKRKAGIMKKAYELATLTGTQVLLLVVSETGIVYTFTTAKFQPLVGAGPGGNPSEGQRLIQACLAVDPTDGSDYVSPGPDGPLLPLPPSAVNRPFETNSAIHGGQIALRTRAHRPGVNPRAKPRPAAIRTQSHPMGDGPPTPTDHPSMLLSPSTRQMHPADYSQGPSVLQGSPRAETMQSAQEYAEMMARSAGPMNPNYPPHPLSAGGRMESYGQQSGPDYGHSGPPPHSAHHLHPHSPDRYQPSPGNHGNSPLQHQQNHHLQQHQMSQGNQPPDHFRQHSYESDRYYQGPPPPDYHSQQQQQQQHPEDFQTQQSRRQ
ncbi:pheromone receptor transcription factor, partial [Phenoliferia sp. Uapishka_3]